MKDCVIDGDKLEGDERTGWIKRTERAMGEAVARVVIDYTCHHCGKMDEVAPGPTKPLAAAAPWM